MSITPSLSGETAPKAEFDGQVSPEDIPRIERAADLLDKTPGEIVDIAVADFFASHAEQLTLAEHYRRQREEIEVNRLGQIDQG